LLRYLTSSSGIIGIVIFVCWKEHWTSQVFVVETAHALRKAAHDAVTNRDLKYVSLFIASILTAHLLIPNEHSINKNLPFCFKHQKCELMLNSRCSGKGTVKKFRCGTMSIDDVILDSERSF